jgi:hypothetical protein
MSPEPEFEEIEEDLLAGEVGVVEECGLVVPVPAQLGTDPLPEQRELVELLLARPAEEVELGVVVHLPLRLFLERGLCIGETVPRVWTDFAICCCLKYIK